MEEHGLDTKLLECFLKRRYHDEKPVDLISVNVTSGGNKGDNYGSIVYKVRFEILTASGQRRKRSIIVKTVAKWTEAFGGVAMEASPTFYSEVKVYTTILQAMESLMYEFGDKRDTLWAGFLGSRPYNLIAFEDLTEKLYNVSERKNCLNLKQSLLTLRSLGRFHAMGKVLISRGLIGQDGNGCYYLASDVDFITKLWFTYFSLLVTGMETWGDEWQPIAKKISGLKDSVNKKWGKLIEKYDKRYEVFNHGDLWNCNMLFQNMEFEDIPVSVKFVDFQCTHINSFIWDVEYFMNSSIIASVRRSNLKMLYAAYQESLEKNLKFFNYTGYIPTIEDVEAEAERIRFVSMSCTVFHMIMISGKQVEMEKIFTGSPEDVLPASVFGDGKAREAVGEDFIRFYNEGVFDFVE